jgi:quercetin dioxygenase-like cupin family protein
MALAAAAALACAVSAVAALRPDDELPAHAVRILAPIGPSPEAEIRGSDVVAEPGAEWQENLRSGTTHRIVWGKDAVERAPPGASRYTQKVYVFPTGTIRVLEFRQSTGGMLHAITMENAIYMLRGSGTVGVAGGEVPIAAGDAVNYPSGMLRGSSDATVILFTVTGSAKNEASRAVVVRARDAKTVKSAEWDHDGQRVRASTPAELRTAPRNAIRLEVTRYSFPGNSIRVAHSFRGGPTSPGTAPLDALIYVTSGKLRFYQGEKVYDAVAGDALREIAGERHWWNRLEDSSFVAISSLPVEGARNVTPTER